MFRSYATMAAFVLGSVSMAQATAMPQDCSAMKIPDEPVKGTVSGKPFIPNDISIHVTKNGFGMNERKFDAYNLEIQSDGIFNEMTVHFLVPAGAKPDGRLFRVLPTDSISGQPAAMEGVPEVQGWDLELEAAGVDTSFTQDIASVRLELGRETASGIPGRVAFCVPSVRATILGTFTAKIVR